MCMRIHTNRVSKPSERPQRRKKKHKKKHTTAVDEPALNSSSLSLCLGKFLLSEADETIYKNNDKDTVFF